ncbi:MAG: geranylgeranylglyceryl/heptaprenylglyceryl phosphate synthase [Sphingobacteriales bacterium]|jgi:phosphoglycerol geranylgeranyltransferase|nr:geranylgeranylglyceryl/heptaprenylglyceryl phosphate synthase [Sphingobacteriales bacterium]MBP9142062.1 geranylgeranylglyceryl/heptaprenylglyceryl phosphate synthase [Chitinophagales bacterium]MDA0199014.1 geranylgeranylglyceryl/heptaprenylglyceryl phosphate synthase [Bacteroidota bacterium]MBK6890124.1 geranylgeranylglyceryl/heptaprenylglyceryl phosphate synthase [Sphingobacteriales bacterium]MBK7527350.1 geranylgeranylglyceryl/heptaprenylglyceryl phosphate synthase [Sphingobacteriales bac
MQRPSIVYSQIIKTKLEGKKQLAVLVDPDKLQLTDVPSLSTLALQAGVNYWFLGGSLVTKHQTDDLAQALKQHSSLPVILFPGSPLQLTPSADAVLFLSLISGRNPDLLIGQHVIAAPLVQAMRLEALPTGYVLIDGGTATTVSYMSGSSPIPANKPDIAACTALAGELLGLKLIYLDAGSGAINSVPIATVAAVKQQIEIPLIVGGGIKTPQQAAALCQAGADLLVIGTAFEQNPQLMLDIAKAIR